MKILSKLDTIVSILMKKEKITLVNRPIFEIVIHFIHVSINL